MPAAVCPCRMTAKAQPLTAVPTCLQHKEKELAYWKQQAKDLEIKCQAALQNLHSPTADRVGHCLTAWARLPATALRLLQHHAVLQPLTVYCL